MIQGKDKFLGGYGALKERERTLVIVEDGFRLPCFISSIRPINHNENKNMERQMKITLNFYEEQFIRVKKTKKLFLKKF